MPDGGKIILRTRNVAAAECAAFGENAAARGRLCRDRGRGHRHRHPARRAATRSSSRSSPPRKSARAPASASSMVYGIVKQTGGYVFCDIDRRHGHDLPHSPAALHRRREPTTPVKQEADQGRRRPHRPRHDPARRGRGGRARLRRPRPRLARLYVLEADNGSRRCEVVEQIRGKIDLVVSDVVMPEMDGPTMFGELRKRGVDGESDFRLRLCRGRLRQEPAGGEDFGFLPKPFTLKQLIEAVKARWARAVCHSVEARPFSPLAHCCPGKF